MSFSGWIIKQCCLHTVEHYSAMKISNLLIWTTTWMSLQKIVLSRKKTITKGHIQYCSIYVPFLKWINYRKQDQVSSFQGLRRRWDLREVHKARIKWITLIDYKTLSKPCIPEINPAWLRCNIHFLCIIGIDLLLFCWGFLPLYSWRMLVYSFIVILIWF